MKVSHSILAAMIVAPLSLSALASAQGSIYDGCGVSKECLGYEIPGVPDENICLESQTCSLVISYTPSSPGFAFFEMMHADPAAADGWVAIGFSADQAMGDDSVVMATATGGVTSRWNNGPPIRDSVATEDFGVVGAVVEAGEGTLYAAFELPVAFPAVNPNDGELKTEDLAQDHIYLCAGGPLDATGGPVQHSIAKYSENYIALPVVE